MDEIKVEQRYIMDLVAYSVFNVATTLLDDSLIDWDYFAKKVHEQKLDCHVFDALTKLGCNNAYYNKLKTFYFRYLTISTNQEYEYNQIIKLFDDNNIDYVPLKGSYMKKYYPIAANRMMGDIDILIPEKKNTLIHKLLIKNGYTCKEKGPSHDVYEHHKIANFEIHHNLFTTNDYYDDNVWKYTSNHTFSIEFNLVYQLGHLSKHILGGGAGLKSFIDIGLFTKKHENEFNLDILYTLLNDTKQKGFFESVLSIIEHSFNIDFSIQHNKLSNDEYLQIITYIFKTGEFGFGEESNYYENQIASDKSRSKLGFAIKKVCIPYKQFKKSSKIIKYVPILLPFGWIIRFFKYLFKSPKQMKNRLVSLKNVDENNYNQSQKIKNILSI